MGSGFRVEKIGERETLWILAYIQAQHVKVELGTHQGSAKGFMCQMQ